MGIRYSVILFLLLISPSIFAQENLSEQNAMLNEMKSLPKIHADAENLLSQLISMNTESCNYNMIYKMGGVEYFYAQDMDVYTDEPPKNCGYALNYPRKDIANLCRAYHAAVNGEIVQCHKSNCTTASYIAIVKMLKQRSDWEEIKHLFDCTFKNKTAHFGAAYNVLVGLDGLRNMVNTFNLGETKVITPKNLVQELTQGWPIPGDPVLINRTEALNFSGHQVIFDHYKFDANDKITHICYWSSNSSTNGVGKICERIGRVQNLHVARISKKEFIMPEVKKALPVNLVPPPGVEIDINKIKIQQTLPLIKTQPEKDMKKKKRRGR